MLIHAARNSSLRVDLQMTSMIDVVFQLLIFFILTFRFVQPEGDLAIKLPLLSQADLMKTPAHVPPMSVNLVADDLGNLRAVVLNDRPLSDLKALQKEVEDAAFSNAGNASSLQVDLICDQHLKYQNVIAALTAVSGRRDAAGQIVPLATNVQLRRAR